MTRTIWTMVLWLGLGACKTAEQTTPTSDTTTTAGTTADTGTTDTTDTTDTGTTTPMLRVHAVTGLGDDLEGVHVLVSDPDGAVVLHAVTGADGTVGVPAIEGTMVTQLAAITDILPDGTLRRSQRLLSRVTPPEGDDFTGRFPPYVPARVDLPEAMDLQVGIADNCVLPEGTERAYVHLTCGRFGSYPLPLDVAWSYLGCGDELGFDLVVYALDGDSYPRGHARLADQVFEAGGSRSYQVCPDDTAFDEVILIASDLPPTVSEVDLRATGEGRSAARELVHAEFSLTPPTDPAVVARRLPAGVHPSVGWSIGVLSRGDPVTSSVAWGQRGLAALPEYVDRSVNDVATIVSLPAPDYNDPARPRVSWAFSDEGALGDVLYVSTQWLREEVSTQWTVIGPATRSGSVRLPVFPDALALFRPSLDHTVGSTTVQQHHVGGGDAYPVNWLTDHPTTPGAEGWQSGATRTQ